MKNLTKLILSAWAVAGLQVYGQNLVQNPGFETGDFTHWTIGSPASFDYGSLVSSSDPHSGSYNAFFNAAPGTGTLSQTILVTAGDVYDVSFWLATDTPGGPAPFGASFGGTQLLSTTDSGTGYNQYDFTDVAAGNGVITFSFSRGNSFEVDDVSVTDVTPVGVPDSGPHLLLIAITFSGVCGWRLRKLLFGYLPLGQKTAQQC